MKFDLSDNWNLDEDDICSEISNTANEIVRYSKSRAELGYIENNLGKLIVDIRNVIGYWVGNTYVGEQKQRRIQLCFQDFWCSLYDLIIAINNNKEKYDNCEILTLGNLLYEGPIYRYIGHGNSQDKSKIIIEYNDFFVSWSKCEKVSYIEQKLYGDYYWIAGITNKEHYGIDLEKINLSRSNEREVVFPTIKDCVTEVRLIKDDEDA